MIMVVPKQSATEPVTRGLGEELVAMSDSFAKENGTEAAVGGNGGAFGDFTSEGSEAIWPVVIAEPVVILILLIVLLRSVILPAVAVVFGVGVAIAIILDALIVRPVLLPAAASLLGRWSWWPLSRQAPPTPPTAGQAPAERPAPAGGLPASA